MKKLTMAGIDNRDSNTMWLHLSDNETVLEIDFNELTDILISFMENNVESEPDTVRKMIESVYTNIQFSINEYLPDLV